nr:microfibril-associated glycoprotein 4-like [Lytechinus pictus]
MRHRVLALRNSGNKQVKIADALGIAQSCVSRILKRYREEGNVRPKKSAGRPRRTSRRDDRQLINMCRRERKMPASRLCRPGRPRDCADIKIVGRSNPNGVYLIYPDGEDAIPITVYCDMETENGGWTVIQRRMDGSVDFYRYWADYKSGFGNVSSEHWLGNEKIHFLSRQKTYELRIELEEFDGQTGFATYSNFSVGNETTNYELSRVDNFVGNSGDCLSYHAGRPFSTRDRDNDISPHEWENCADRYKGGWWYHACHHANLNGQYGEKMSAETTSHGVVWYDWSTGRGLPYTLRKTEMKFRPTNYLRGL